MATGVRRLLASCGRRALHCAPSMRHPCAMSRTITNSNTPTATQSTRTLLPPLSTSTKRRSPHMNESSAARNGRPMPDGATEMPCGHNVDRTTNQTPRSPGGAASSLRMQRYASNAVACECLRSQCGAKLVCNSTNAPRCRSELRSTNRERSATEELGRLCRTMPAVGGAIFSKFDNMAP